MHGEGIMREADGTKFKGHFENGLKEGSGLLVDSQGNRFEGNFHRGEKHGEFVEKDRNGNVLRRVTYVNGVAQATPEAKADSGQKKPSSGSASRQRRR